MSGAVAGGFYGGDRPDRVIPIRTAGLGATVARHRVQMTKRRCMAYAAGIGAQEPLYLDDARPEGVTAPLGIAASLEWRVFVTPDYLKAVGRDLSTLFNGLVHGWQMNAFHRPVRPDDLLDVSARIVGMRATRAGALVTVRIDTNDAADGAPVTTGWFGALYRGTPLDAGEGGALEAAPEPTDRTPPPEPAVRDAIEIPRGQPHIYSECADIWNPIHTERRFALDSGLPDIILHGTCTWAMALQRLAARHRPGEALPFRRFGARFTGMVAPGQTIAVESGAPQDGVVRFVVRNAAGEAALSAGIAELA